MDVARVHIVGGPGTGKTTRALRLARQRGVEPFKLDDITFDQHSGVARPLPHRQTDINSIVAEPSWVTEGIYLWWTAELLRDADLVVWLDLPMRVAFARKLPHHLKRTLARGYPYAGRRGRGYLM